MVSITCENRKHDLQRKAHGQQQPQGTRSLQRFAVRTLGAGIML